MPSQPPTVDQLAEEFVERYRRGERPPISEYTQRYPEHAVEIRDLFPALVMIERFAPDDSVLEPNDKSAVEPRADQPQQLGDYRILREIGHGGMGIVYEAEQISLGRRHVALKVLSQQMQLDSQQKQRFQREAKAAASLHHTNIVPVFGVGEEGGLHYYVMQFIQGLGLDEVLNELRRLQITNRSPLPGPLIVEKPSTPNIVSANMIAQSLVTGEFQPQGESSDQSGGWEDRGDDLTARVLRNEGEPTSPAGGANQSADRLSLSPTSAALPRRAQDSSGNRKTTYWHSVANIGLQVAEALQHAHDLGVLHRDIKPSNLLLDLQGNVWVTDFGLAKLEDQQNITHTGDVLGTLRYMAPESFDGRADARSEVYSLGLTLYEMLALKPAFDESDRNKLIKQVTTSEPPALEPALGIPRDLATICQKCIETDPVRRYQTAKALAEDLRRWLNDEPIKARPISRLERMARWCRRNPMDAGLLAGMVLVTVLGFAGVLWQWREALLARKTADEQRVKARWLAYKASIRAATASLGSDNVSLVEQALHDAPVEHRGWEWRYLVNQIKSSATALRSGPLWKEPFVEGGGMAINPKGNMLAAGLRDGSIRFWNLPEGKLIKVLPRNDKRALRLYFSPDGERLVGFNGNALFLWNVKTGEQLVSVNFEKAKQTGIHFSLDGSILAYLRHGEMAIRRWDCRTGRRLSDFEAMAPHLASDKGYLSTTGENLVVPWKIRSRAYVLNVKTGKRHNLLTIPGQTYEFHSLAFSADQSRLAVGGRWPDNAVSLWDIRSGERRWKARGHTNSVHKVIVSPNGSLVASLSRDQTVRLWELKSGKPVAVLRGHSGYIYDAVFSPDGARIFTCSLDKTVRVWDVRTGVSLFILRGHETNVVDIEILPGGQMLVSQGLTGKVLFWNLEFLKRNLLRGHTSFVYDATFSPDGSRIVSVGWDKTIRLWDVATGRQRAFLDGLPSHAMGLAIHPDGRHVACALGGLNKGIVIWDMHSGQSKHRLQITTDFSGAAGIVFHPDGSLLAAGSSDGGIYFWETVNYRQVKKLVGHNKHVTAICFDRRGAKLFSGDYFGEMRAWNVASGQKIAVWKGHQDRVTSLTVSPNGKLLASTSIDTTVRIWDSSTRRPATTLECGVAVYDVAFHPTEKRLALACADDTIRLWDTEKWQEITQLRGHRDYVHSVDFSPDGTRLVTGSGDFTVRVWDSVPAKQRIKEWTPAK